MKHKFKIKEDIGGTEHCCVKKCSATSTIILGARTSFARQYDIKCDVGLCQKHWDDYCAVPDKPVIAALKQRVAPPIEKIEEPPIKRRKMRLRVRRR